MTTHSHDAGMPRRRKEGQIVTRFAPSPTGFMHVGGVRTALFAWAFARKHGDKGTFILRIEDTDKEREVEGSIGHIMESLKWLGLTWDEGPDKDGSFGPYIQSERLDTYRHYAQVLIDKGLAYADPYSQEELEAFRKKAEEEKRPFLYRDHRPQNPPQWIDRDGERKPLRLRIKDEMLGGPVSWNDLVRGGLSAGPESLDDYILIKSDGYPTYNFAHIIDDLLMGVTHICRADEFISSTPKFLALYDALGLKENPDAGKGELSRPSFATLPPIMSPDGKKKLGKRDGAKDILAYREEGYLPEAMVNFLAFIGWNPGDEKEIMSPAEIAAAFDFGHVQNAGGKLNEDKLIWTNREYLVRMSDEEWLARFFEYAEGAKDEFAARGIDMSTEKFKSIMLSIMRERISYFGEVMQMLKNGEFDYFFSSPLDNPEGDGVDTVARFRSLLICPEKMRKNGAGEKTAVDEASTAAILSQAGEILERHVSEDAWDRASLKDALWPFAEHEGRGIVLWPLRVALSGAEKSPDPFALAAIIGKKDVLMRIAAAVETLRANG